MTRLLNQKQVAEVLGKSPVWLAGKLPELQQQGFPHKDEFFNAYDSKAIHAWLDKRSGLIVDQSDEQEWLEAI